MNNMKDKIKILHLEDDPNDAELVREMIAAGGLDVQIEVANSKQTFWNALDNKEFDLIISDYNLPEFDGLKALIEIQKKAKNIPFIFCSGTIGEERAVQCLQLGAMDYVLKQRMDRLVPAIKRAIRLVEEMKNRQVAENQLKRVMYAVENTNEAIFLTDTKGIITYVNPYFTTMYEWTREEVVGKATPRILKSGKHTNDFYEKLWNSLITNKSLKLEMVNQTKSGKIVEIKNLISPNYDDKNKLIGYVAIQTDISERKKNEREILKAKNEAEEMNNLKSYFLANISHEIRTPLISILGFSEILVDELENSEHRELAEHILDGGKRLMETVNSILTLQNIEKNKIEVSFTNFNLSSLVEKLFNKTKKVAGEKKLNCECRIEEKNIILNSDPILLEKALSNIIDNAIKFTKKGGVGIFLKTQKEGDSLFAVINIADTGIGIPNEKIDFVFQQFRQGSEGLSRAHEGMGIGLTIAKQYLDLLHGKISIKSEIGKGTLVQIKLPMQKSDVKIPSTSELLKTTIIEPKPEIKASKPLILLVEDNPSNRLLFKRFLSNEFQVEEAEDGLTGIAKAEAANYDLILMDINLGPGIDGVETFKRIRNLPNYSSIPVIAVTAFGMKEDKNKFLDYGFTDYMQKPVDKNELTLLIKKLVNKN